MTPQSGWEVTWGRDIHLPTISCPHCQTCLCCSFPCWKLLTALQQPLTLLLPSHSCFSWVFAPCSFSWSQFQPGAAFQQSRILPVISLGKHPQHCTVQFLVQTTSRQTSYHFGHALTCRSEVQGVFRMWALSTAPAGGGPKAGPYTALQHRITTRLVLCPCFQCPLLELTGLAGLTSPKEVLQGKR